MEQLQKVLFFGIVVPVLVIWVALTSLVKGVLRLLWGTLVAILKNVYGRFVAGAGALLTGYILYLVLSNLN